ncbi:MAG: MATE family efflux transporter [Lachnospira sp.]|nr:MATE family efflux transporter [Lachnospira sp.]
MSVSLSEHFTYKRLLRFVFPCIIMMIVTSIYSIVDGFFVSNCVGKNAFAAVNLIMPVLMALSAFGFMIGTGGSALVAFTLGEGKKEKANEIFSMLILSEFLFGMLVTVVGFIFMPQIARALGASSLIIEDCVRYGRIGILTIAFFMMQNSFQSFLVTAEQAKMGLIVSIACGLTNMTLDFLLVYVWPLGVTGAALATGISELIGAFIPLIYFMRKNKSRLRLVRPRFDARALRRACSNGASEMLTNLSASIIGMLYNMQLLKLAAENGVAAYGVIMYISFIFMAIYFGYSVGVNPVIGYHYGAGNQKELKNILKKSLVLTSIAAVVMTSAAQLLAPSLATLFVGYDKILHDMTVNGLRLYSLVFLLCGFNIFGSAFFTGLNNGKISAIISFLRTLVIQIACIFILPVFLGLNGIWLSVSVAEGLTLFVTASLLVVYRKRYGY